MIAIGRNIRGEVDQCEGGDIYLWQCIVKRPDFPQHKSRGQQGANKRVQGCYPPGFESHALPEMPYRGYTKGNSEEGWGPFIGCNEPVAALDCIVWSCQP